MFEYGIHLLKKDPFGKRRIDTVRISDAKCWLIHLQQVEKKSYSSIHFKLTKNKSLAILVIFFFKFLLLAINVMF